MSPIAEGFRQLGHLLATDALAVIAVIALTSWLLRRREIVLAWLSCAGLAWCLFSIAGLPLVRAPPFDLADRQFSLLYPLLFVTLGLAASFLGVAVPRTFGLAVAWVSLALGLAAIPFPHAEIMRLICLASVGAGLLLLGILATRTGSLISPVEISLSIAFYMLALAATAFDLVADRIWPGAGLRLSPYAGVLLLGFSGLVVLRRMLASVDAREKLNEALGQRIETTKANLIASERARHSLEVAHAVKLERERLMREIHDGIGSSLVAALASAERQGRSQTTAVGALKGALTDLRVAIDSLEPVEGNVATLLASLRYRYEPELRKSGIAIKWMVEDVPELEWLDAPSALHVLRILQESISNTLGHSRATQLSFKCKMALLLGRPGLRVEVEDNGSGFDPEAPTMGRGRRNMAQRAEALGGKLDILSTSGQGTTTILWLPLIRRYGLNAEADPVTDQ